MAKKSDWKKLSSQNKITLVMLLILLFTLPLLVIAVLSPAILFPKAAYPYPTPTSNPNAPNLVLNSSFENVDKNEFPINWVAGEGLTNADRTTDKVYLYGHRSFHFVGSSKRKELVQRIEKTFIPGTVLNFYARPKFDNGNLSGLIAVEYDFENSNGIYDTFQMKIPYSSADWLDRGDKYVIPELTSAIVVKLVVENQKGQIYFDDINVKATPPNTPTPYPTPTSACKTGLNSFSVSVPCDGGYRYVSFTCYDGYSGTIGGDTSCKTSDYWSQYAQQLCAGRSSCTPAPSGTPYPYPTPTPISSPTFTPVPQTPYPTPSIYPYPTLTPSPQ